MTEQLSLHLKMSNRDQTSPDLITTPPLGSKVTGSAYQRRTAEQVVKQTCVCVCVCSRSARVRQS